MSFTASGPVFLAFGLFLLLRAPDRLAQGVVFFAPFSATAVLNLTSLTYGLSPAVLFLLLFVVAGFAYGAAWKPVRVAADHLVQVSLLGAFAGICILSLGLRAATGGVEFYQLTQAVFLLFGVGTAIILSFAFLHPTGVERAVAAMQAAAVFVSLWGFVQVGCFVAGVDYPAFLFNNSASDFADMFDQRLDRSIRIASVTVEPSFLAFSLLHFGAFGATLLACEHRLRGHGLVWATLLPLATVAASTSSTGYVGLATLAVLIGLRRPGLVLLAAGVGAVVALVALAALPAFRDAVWTMTIGKANDLSYAERMASIDQALQLFTEAPLIGHGWGASKSYSLVTGLLADTGILGLTAFAIALAATVIAGRAARRGEERGENWQLAAFSLAIENTLLLSLVCSVVSGFKYVVLDMWCAWAIALAITSRLVTARAETRRLDTIARLLPVGLVAPRGPRSGGTPAMRPGPVGRFGSSRG